MYSDIKKANKCIIIIMLSLVATNTFANSTQQNEQQCLAKVIYHEARGETTNGKTAVAKVVLNRKNHKKFPKTICSVINQIHVVNKRKRICQFSWVCSNKNKIDVSSKSWQDAKILSSNILNHKIPLPNLGPDVLFFRSRHSFKKFDKSYKLVKKIDNSLFYEKRWV